ncbi:glycoside hydrolase family 57 protein [Labilibacter marinus]|uniref:glycoside hydrolase family 57 protein n=1 Tax=Labilibacter marinus TaxID=1477105 RepID=UPI00082A779E|nr:glycoside hydrolase family 57 protein [Labilibacter marinus]
MKTICLYFQVHQPFRFRRYRFFDIGNDHYYYDDYSNESILLKIAEKCYLPTNKILLDIINANKGKFKVAFSLSGVAIKQFQLYAPEVIESFQTLAKTGQVEFLAETYCHSLVALKNKPEFERQVKMHGDVIKELFNQEPKVFRNTELIYSDEMGEMVYKMGYKAMLTEGAKHVLGWKSPNYLYCNSINPKLKVLLKNFVLSDDIAFRFGNQGWSEHPLTPQKYTQWLKDLDPKAEVVNLFMDYETFGEHQWEETGIFKFLKELPEEILKHPEFSFSTPSEVADNLQPVSAVNVPYPISWADEERDLTAWLGNEMQEEAFNKLYALLPKIEKCKDAKLQDDWIYMQASDHFYYMCTKYFSDGDVHAYFNPYESPYQAFINYMNVLSDFTLRLNAAVPENSQDETISNLTSILEDKEAKIAELEASVKKLRAKKKKKKSL